MSRFIAWLLGLDRIHLTEAGTLGLRFATPPAPWVMLAGAVLAGFLIFRLYRSMAASQRWRCTLGTLRFVAVMIVLFALGQPILVVRRNYLDRSQVLLLIDESQSMTVRDAQGPAGATARRVSRWDALRQYFERPTGRAFLAALTQRQQVVVCPFDDRVAQGITLENANDAARLIDYLNGSEATGTGTDTSSALGTALAHCGGSPLAAIIVVSDGRQTRSDAAEATLAQVQARGIPIHTVAIGADFPIRDLILDGVAFEEDVFVRDTVNLRAGVHARGFAPSAEIELQLRDKVSGELLASRKAVVGADETVEADLTYRPLRGGRRVLVVSAVANEEEETLDNNTAEIVIRAHDEKIGVLYVDAAPRFEYRYLKNMLLRESSIESSCLLLSATPGFEQEGSRPIRRFPQSVEEMRGYDVVILGDVDPHGDWISPMQSAMLCDHVTIGGCGVGFVAGETNMPQRLRQTAFEKLLPVRLDPDFSGRYEQGLADAFTPRLTHEGKSADLFRMESDSPDEDWIGKDGGWYWFARVLGTQPAAAALLTHPTALSGGQPMPLVVMGRAGAGRSLFIGSDDAWRWRESAGEGAYEAFWLRAIRMLARGRALGSDCPWKFQVSRRTAETRERVQLRLTCADRTVFTEAQEVIVDINDARLGRVGRMRLAARPGPSPSWEGEYVTDVPGHYLFSPVLPEGAGNCKKIERPLDVFAAVAERRNVLPDHEFLSMLAARTGGKVLRLDDDLAAWAKTIPDRGIEIPDDLEEPLWDKRFLMFAFVSLLSAEWIARKRLGLT